MSKSFKRLVVEEEEKWYEWAEKIPTIALPMFCRVRIVPPHDGAMARFVVESRGVSVSVYLDCYDALGHYHDGGPYWEVYPVDGDAARCALDDADGLSRLIYKSINREVEP